MAPTDQPGSRSDPLTHRVERVEELLMFADRRHETLAATIDELSRQLAAMHKTVDQLSKRIKDAERLASGNDPPRTPEDDLPPHNAF
ncbi:MAG TPA: SlyX family protein [Phycisphaerales bacterium]|nr:SlyX family protein [Phycisphaerales bacterium]